MRDIAEELSSRSKKQGLERQIDEVKDEYNKLQTLIQTKEKVETTYVNDWTFFSLLMYLKMFLWKVFEPVVLHVTLFSVGTRMNKFG